MSLLLKPKGPVISLVDIDIDLFMGKDLNLTVLKTPLKHIEIFCIFDFSLK